MKTLWRTRRDSPAGERTLAVDQSLSESLSTRAANPTSTSVSTATSTDFGTSTSTDFGTRSEWTARPLRPVAHWVSMPASGGGSRLQMVWEIPNPIPAAMAG